MTTTQQSSPRPWSEDELLCFHIMQEGYTFDELGGTLILNQIFHPHASRRKVGITQAEYKKKKQAHDDAMRDYARISKPVSWEGILLDRDRLDEEIVGRLEAYIQDACNQHSITNHINFGNKVKTSTDYQNAKRSTQRNKQSKKGKSKQATAEDDQSYVGSPQSEPADDDRSASDNFRQASKASISPRRKVRHTAPSPDPRSSRLSTQDDVFGSEDESTDRGARLRSRSRQPRLPTSKSVPSFVGNKYRDVSTHSGRKARPGLRMPQSSIGNPGGKENEDMNVMPTIENHTAQPHDRPRRLIVSPPARSNAGHDSPLQRSVRSQEGRPDPYGDLVPRGARPPPGAALYTSQLPVDERGVFIDGQWRRWLDLPPGDYYFHVPGRRI